MDNFLSDVDNFLSDVDKSSSDVVFFIIFPYETPPNALNIFYSFLQNQILNAYFNQLHPSHRRDACKKQLYWTAAFVNKIWHV